LGLRKPQTTSSSFFVGHSFKYTDTIIYVADTASLFDNCHAKRWGQRRWPTRAGWIPESDRNLTALRKKTALSCSLSTRPQATLEGWWVTECRLFCLARY
jgi:hypothetical protein